MIRTQIQIHSSQLKWLKQQALGKGVSMSQLIRDCIEFYRDHSEKTRRLEGIRKKALTAVGRFSAGTGHTTQD